MQGIEFENDDSTQNVWGEQKQPAMVRLVMKLGMKDEITANYALLGAAGLAVVISIFLIFGVARTPPPPDRFIPIAGPDGGYEVLRK